MTDLNISKTTVLERNISDYSISSQPLEFNAADEVKVDFPKAAKYFGYYKKYGQLKKAIDTLWIYVVGKGYTTNADNATTLKYLRGTGEDTSHNIFWSLGVTSMVVGDAFAEIIRNDKDEIINLKPISPERMRVVYGKNGMIKGYEYNIQGGKEPTKFKPSEIFHMSNDRIADEQRGVSVIEACEWVIDALDEARRDYRQLIHRNIIPVRIIEIDTDDTTKRDQFMAQYKDAINKGEVLVIPKGSVEFKEDQISIQDPTAWIQSLENYFYLAVGIPKVIASPDGLSEGSSKISYLIFEPIYTYRQLLLEADIRNQLNLEVTFNRPASLQDNIQSNEAKNTSQMGFQPNDMQVNINRQ